MRAEQISTAQRSVPEERHGYGYQIWRTRQGFAMFGMGSQLGLCVPENGVTLCTIADTQLDSMGVQQIHNAFHAHLVAIHLLPDNPMLQDLLDQRLATLACLPVSEGIGVQPAHFGRYQLMPNPMGMHWVALEATMWQYQTDEGIFSVPYALGKQALSTFAGNEQPCMASGGWPDENTFHMRCYFWGDTPCGFDVLMGFSNGKVTLRLTRARDLLTDGLEGEAYGQRKD